MTRFFKQTLFRILGLNAYLSLMQKTFLVSYATNLIRKNPTYTWHYFVKEIIKPDDVIIDIGANLGYYTYIFSKLINDSGHLYCVEPVAAYRKQLTKLIKSDAPITLLPFALGEENKSLVTLGMPSAFKNLGYLRHGTVTIETNERSIADDFTFTSQLKKASEVFGNLQKLDYIKCDIEGYETVVLPEMKALLQQHEPLVQLETWGEQISIMLQFFSSIGFEAYHLENDQLINYKKLPQHLHGSSDILFAAQSKMERLKNYIKE